MFGHTGMVKFGFSDEGIPDQISKNDIFVGGGNKFQVVFVSESFELHAACLNW